MSSTPLWLAASISTTSMWRSSAMPTQLSQTPHGSVVGPPLPSGPMQLSARAMIRAVVVLPIPRTPVSTNACAIRPLAIAFDRVRTIASWPIRSAKRDGRDLRARTRYGVGAGLSVISASGPLLGICETWRGLGETRREVGGWTTTRAETRYGCFLPDLTGLARSPSTANLPLHYISFHTPRGKAAHPAVDSQDCP